MVRLGKASRALGSFGEGVATQYLQSKGFQVLARNWRCEHGELDIVAWEPSEHVVVFIEVKTRSGSGFGAPIEAVTPTKARRLYQLAYMWLDAHEARGSKIRVDAIGVLLGGKAPEITHVRGVAA
ncbi:YraN family protein [uncultured Tessaracoccus sp.]|uniref:YraN family protein n=1 Tax=uncultured Tessaracoccus sp. TaxID=905023 RepID=UPI00262403EB|nr:YraN family protein [uncultured Tessaracoccus sp.]